MKNNFQHIDTPIISRPPGKTYGHMYSMHKYWSKKSPDVVAAYIENYTDPGDIVLDPFCGSGIIACEVVRLGRRAISIDINPMATFITKITLTPVNLSRLRWAFEDLKSICREAVSEMFVTKCSLCHKNAEVEFLVKDGEVPTKIAYKCDCSRKRLFKDPDKRDKNLAFSFERRKVPYWYPHNVRLPNIRKERFEFLHELFTRRNLIALSIIFNAIEKIGDQKIRDLMKLSFTAALAKCSRLKPLAARENTSRPSLQEGWIAPRFYAPQMWEEVNPWLAFEQSFERVYKGKTETNAKLKYVTFGSNYNDLSSQTANVAVFTGSADAILEEQLPEGGVDYVLTDPPFGEHIPYLALSTFWGAWLRFEFDYGKELIVDRMQQKTINDYENILGQILTGVRRVIRPNKYVNIIYHDVKGPYLHKMLKLMTQSRILPERVLHQPPPSSFSATVRWGEGNVGDYIIRGRVVEKVTSPVGREPEENLRQKILQTAKTALEIRGGSTTISTLLHSVYQELSGKDILAFAEFPAEQYLKDSIKGFTLRRGSNVQLISKSKPRAASHTEKEIRETLLDAKSLYVNDPLRGTKKNQVFQLVLQRFQGHGINIDDIRSEYEKIKEAKARKHRRERLPKLLHAFGENMNFSCSYSEGANDKVIWKSQGNVVITFEIAEEGILVRASSEGDIGSEMGTISDSDLERALGNWCRNNPNKGEKLLKILNSVGDPEKTTVSYRHLLMKVLKNEKLCTDHYLITLEVKEQNFEPQPGQFLLVICDPDGKRTITDDGQERGYALTLRRPFSVHGIHYENFDQRVLATPPVTPYEIKEVIKRRISKIDILYKKAGKGTQSLSKVVPGKFLDVIGPIGNGFKIAGTRKAIIVAGGIGVAPLVALAERLRYFGSEVYLYFGALKKDLLLLLVKGDARERLLQPIVPKGDSVVELGYANGSREFVEVIEDEFKKIGAQVKVCTDDGSLGYKGLVTDLLKEDIRGNVPGSDTTIFACGPSKMLEEVSQIAERYNVRCQVLLEERMACGIGACLSCTCHVRGRDGGTDRERVCVDGPVFDSRKIVWQH